MYFGCVGVCEGLEIYDLVINDKDFHVNLFGMIFNQAGPLK